MRHLTFLAVIAAMLSGAPVLAAKKADPKSGWKAGSTSVEQSQPAARDQAYAAFDEGRYIKAKELAEAEAAKGIGPSHTMLGMIYERGLGVPRDFDKAADQYLAGAKAGDLHAQFAIGVMLAEGRGIKKNKKQAAQFFELAAAKSHPAALYNLAMIYIDGDARSQDYKQAAQLLERAAKLDHAPSEYDLAALYKDGRGVKKSYEKAVYWLKKAAEAGITNAELEYGIALFLGKGVPKNEALGFQMLRRAAEKGNPVAQNRLAHAYAGGRGIEIDPVAAAKWHLLSRQAGVSDFGLDGFLGSVSADDRKKAEKAAFDWQKKTDALLR